MGMTELDRKLQARLLVGRRVEGDRLVLADAVLLAALDGSRPLTAGERAALQASPLTTRRLRALAEARKAQARRTEAPGADTPWRGSSGMLRAADSGAAPDARMALVTDDGAWRLHVVGGRVIVQLDPHSRLAERLLRSARAVHVRVLDGAGNPVLEGPLDSDGELEAGWPFAEPPAQHFQRHGGRFRVEPSAGPDPDPGGGAAC
ncbi:hypothetical protein [Massilia consociata]|uniref:Uncharacterized protein n=1 Tax=Massilia consociata TaxID=760117 RepID=A0ABV6FDS4_9BURK